MENISTDQTHQSKSNQVDPRPTVSKFTYFQEQKAIWRNAKMLKSSPVYINEDLCQENITAQQ